jgi:hypothetical protein
MQISEDNRPIFRFSMFKAWWSSKQKAMERYFPEEPENVSSVWMDFGAKVADALNKKEPWVSHLELPEYDQSEYRVIETFPEVPEVLIRGTLDRFSTKRHSIIDDKCCKNRSSAAAKQYQEQLLFYQVMIEQQLGWVDSTSYIHWIPVDMDDNGIIRFTGEPPELIPYLTTPEIRKEMREKIISTAKDINTLWTAYKAGHVKI